MPAKARQKLKAYLHPAPWHGKAAGLAFAQTSYKGKLLNGLNSSSLILQRCGREGKRGSHKGLGSAGKLLEPKWRQ